MQWDLFCRVIDNHGDIGVCWRLATNLAARGARVRLWIDDAGALAWMAPDGSPGVTVRPWPTDDELADAPRDVVIEAFGCELPPGLVQRMVAAERAPLWINLEYLSAERFAERGHCLPSPQPNGLRKWFFYPGFSAKTGGLIRERDLLQRQQAFDAGAWLAARGVRRGADEQIVSLFCYEQAALPAWLDQWSTAPTLLLLTAGQATTQVRELLGPALTRGALRAVLVPALTQRQYDELLWASDLNLVRGEDSFVRAQWAGKPFVWQIYAQDDGAHRAKLDAFLALFLAGAEPALAVQVRAAFHECNGVAPATHVLASSDAWRRHCIGWRDRLLAQSDLATQLLGFVAETS